MPAKPFWPTGPLVPKRGQTLIWTGNYIHAQVFKQDWESGKRTVFPFSCPAPGDDAEAGSWRRLGYCVAWGTDHDEIATVDFHNFLMMYQYVQKLTSKSPYFAHLSKIFVEPYACLEISCIEANRKQLDAVEKAVAAGESGYPVQVVTGAPGETSLRIYKRRSQQDYDYDLLLLELVEWERVHGGVLIPFKVAKILEDDATRLAKAAGKEKLTKELVGRMSSAFRCLSLMLASYAAFLHKGWATDTYTGAFAGRNFGGGPRDANEWGPLARLGTTGGIPKAGTACASVDLKDLRITIVDDLYRMFEIYASEPDKAFLDQDHGAAWLESSLPQATDALAKMLAEVDKKLQAQLNRDFGSLEKRNNALSQLLKKELCERASKLTKSENPLLAELSGIFLALE